MFSTHQWIRNSSDQVSYVAASVFSVYGGHETSAVSDLDRFGFRSPIRIQIIGFGLVIITFHVHLRSLNFICLFTYNYEPKIMCLKHLPSTVLRRKIADNGHVSRRSKKVGKSRRSSWWCKFKFFLLIVSRNHLKHFFLCTEKQNLITNIAFLTFQTHCFRLRIQVLFLRIQVIYYTYSSTTIYSLS